MADPFVAEIRIFGFNFPPRGWAGCNGQIMPISQNTALFALLGTIYGGDGKSTFALPDLGGSAPMHLDDASFPLGSAGGAETETLVNSEMPVHTHFISATNQPAQLLAPDTDRILARSAGGNAYQSNTTSNLVQMDPTSLVPAGNSQPHNNMQPFLAFNFCIALQGVFPQRP